MPSLRLLTPSWAVGVECASTMQLRLENPHNGCPLHSQLEGSGHQFQHASVGPACLLRAQATRQSRRGVARARSAAAAPCTPFLRPGERRNGRGDRAQPLPRTAGRVGRLGRKGDARLRKTQAVPLGRTRTNIAAGNLPPIYMAISTPIDHSFAATWRVARVQWKGQ
jgi:hypothetical protein